MAKANKVKSGGNKKMGRNSIKCKQYRALGTREKNKLKRVLKSNGEAAAIKYAKQHVLSSYLKTIMKGAANV